MKVKCFGSDALIEADDADAAAAAFMAHGQESHTWSYPEEAIRNYARNYAEATERLTGSTERLSEIAAITVHPVTKDRIDNWLRFFDHDAFAGNPDWASCYCLEPHVPATPSNLSAYGAKHGGPWPSDFGAGRCSGISRTPTADPPGGSTPRDAPTTVCTGMSIPTDPSRHPSSGSRASSSPRRSDGKGSPRHCSIA